MPARKYLFALSAVVLLAGGVVSLGVHQFADFERVQAQGVDGGAIVHVNTPSVSGDGVTVTGTIEAGLITCNPEGESAEEEETRVCNCCDVPEPGGGWKTCTIGTTTYSISGPVTREGAVTITDTSNTPLTCIFGCSATGDQCDQTKWYSFSEDGLPTGSYTVTISSLDCVGTNSGSATFNVDVEAPPAPSVDIKANDKNGPIDIPFNTPVTLSWVSSNASSCDGGGPSHWRGAKAVNGSFVTPNLTLSANYAITCVNSEGTTEVTDRVQVNVLPPPINPPSVDLKVNGGKSATIESVQSANLTWSSENTSSCIASGPNSWNGSKPLNNSVGESTGALAGPNEHTFSLTCEDGSNNKASSSVTVVVEGIPPLDPPNAEGQHDSINNTACTTGGWAVDPDDRKIDLAVSIYSDGEFVTSVTANQPRATLDAQGKCPGGTCAFTAALGDKITKGEAHSIKARAHDAQSGQEVDLGGTPLEINCIEEKSADTGTIVVKSFVKGTTTELPTKWTLTGPDEITERPNVKTASKAYSGKPTGIYVIDPDSLTGYKEPKVSPEDTQTLVADGDTITFTITYEPKSGNPPDDPDPYVPTLVVRPENTVTIQEGFTASFEAFYDEDGDGTDFGEVEVTAAASWESKNTGVLKYNGVSGGAAKFVGEKEGTADITATYNGLSDDGSVNVNGHDPDFSCVGAPLYQTVQQGGSINYTVSVFGLGYFGGVTFQPGSLPAHSSATFNPTQVNANPLGVQTKMKFTAGLKSPPGKNMQMRIWCVPTEPGPSTHQTRVHVTIEKGPPGGETHAECVAGACTQVAGAGPNRCSTSADCGGGGGGVHGVCDAAQNACVNQAGGGASSCSTDPSCGGVLPTHLECQNNACVIVGGPGPSDAGCLSAQIGDSCTTEPPPPPGDACDLTAAPALIYEGNSSDIAWSCEAGVSACELRDEGGALVAGGGASGSTSVNPPETTTYTLSCDAGAITEQVTVRVLDIGEVPPR